MTVTSPQPEDLKLYAAVKAEADRKFASTSGIYRSAWIVREYKKRGGVYVGDKPKPSTGLTRWFREKWVDLNRPTKDGKGFEQCGRESATSADKTKYPLCRPSVRVTKETPRTFKELSPESIEAAKKEKARVKGTHNIKFVDGGKKK